MNNRGFLNKESGLAAFEWEVSNVELYKSDNHKYLDADFTVSDCSRTVSLDFGIYSEDDYNLRLEKIELLISEFIKFKDALIQEYNKEITEDEESVQEG